MNQTVEYKELTAASPTGLQEEAACEVKTLADMGYSLFGQLKEA